MNTRTTKNILVLNGHPNPDSFNYALAKAYQSGAEESGASVTLIHIAELQFDSNLKFGYRQRMEMEPDLVNALEQIRKADHLVWVHPVWWGGFPAIMKGFIDRLFLPGLTFKYKENSLWWDKLLTGKSARIITTIDQPAWYYRLVYRNPSVNQLKRSILQFCGIKPVRVSYIGIMKTATAVQREKWLGQVRLLGKQQK